MCVSVVDWHLPVCYCILQSTVTVFTIATVAVTTARRTTTTAATITVTSISGSVGRSVEGLWKQKDRFQTATSNVLTPLLTSKGNNRARPYLQQWGYYSTQCGAFRPALRTFRITVHTKLYTTRSTSFPNIHRYDIHACNYIQTLRTKGAYTFHGT